MRSRILRLKEIIGDLSSPLPIQIDFTPDVYLEITWRRIIPKISRARAIHLITLAVSEKRIKADKALRLIDRIRKMESPASIYLLLREYKVV